MRPSSVVERGASVAGFVTTPAEFTVAVAFKAVIFG
jgi:hypothetical protein